MYTCFLLANTYTCIVLSKTHTHTHTHTHALDYFQLEREQTVEQLKSALTTLQSDTDRDVVYFSGGDVASFVRPHPLGELWHRTESQASEDQYHDAVDTLDGGGERFQSEHEAWLRTWEEGEAISGLSVD